MTGSAEASSRAAVTALLAAIESRDLRAVGRTLGPRASWQNVPHARITGRDEIVAFLAGILTWADDVSWDVLTARYDDRRAWIERVDRFRLDGEWFDVRCNGVFEVDEEGLVAEVRDYVDLGEWRARVQPVLERLSSRSAIDVVTRHLDAVRRGDVVSMAADYAIDAVLVRGADSHRGWCSIADYFDGVPARLGGRAVTFDEVRPAGAGVVETRWSIPGEPAAAGIDTFVVSGGRIVHQTVELIGDDF
jgi:limonene-1,2-epoxide hydrolase